MRALERTARRLRVPLVDREWVCAAVLGGKLPDDFLRGRTPRTSPLGGPLPSDRGDQATASLGGSGTIHPPRRDQQQQNGGVTEDLSSPPDVRGTVRDNARETDAPPLIEFSFAEAAAGGRPSDVVADQRGSRPISVQERASPSPSWLSRPTGPSGKAVSARDTLPSPHVVPKTEQQVAQVRWLETINNGAPASPAPAAELTTAGVQSGSGAAQQHRRYHSCFSIRGTDRSRQVINLQDCVELVRAPSLGPSNVTLRP